MERTSLRRTLVPLVAVIVLVWPVAVSQAGLPHPSLSPEMCGLLKPIPLPGGGAMCTHGADPAPPGVDIRVSQPPSVPGQSGGILFGDPPNTPPTKQASAQPAIGCFGDGQSGNRVQAVYARASDRPDRFAQYLPSIQQWAAETDAVFNASAGRVGSTRHIRFVTDTRCQLVVNNVVLSPTGDDNLNNTIAEMAAQGYNRSDRKYLVWMDATALCGIAGYYVDDRSDISNNNNGRTGIPGLVARIDSGCWGLASQGQSVEAHELMHSLGSIMPSAPHATAEGHCTDASDRMCYSDGPGVTMQTVCPDSDGALFDCHNDDYFNPQAPPGSYISSHWNTANSTFLAAAGGDPTISIADTQVVEGDSGTRNASFVVSLAAPSSGTVSVYYQTGDGTATAGSDYDATSGTLYFAPGQTKLTINVPVRGDTIPEDDETFFVYLSNASGGPILDGGAVGVIINDDPKRVGYRLVASDGGIFSYGDAGFYGSTGNIKLNRPIVGMASTPTNGGYWMVATDGGIFSFGDAGFFGSAGGETLKTPIAAMANTHTGRGYWLAEQDGTIFNYGDAAAVGSAPGVSFSDPVVGIAASPGDGGVWLTTRSGHVYALGNAPDLGSVPRANQPVVAIAATPSGSGYWLVASDGGIYAFGDAGFFGSTANLRLSKPVVGMAPSGTGNGYWLVATDGGIFAFGDAQFLGSTGAMRLNQPVNGMSTVR